MEIVPFHPPVDDPGLWKLFHEFRARKQADQIQFEPSIPNAIYQAHEHTAALRGERRWLAMERDLVIGVVHLAKHKQSDQIGEIRGHVLKDYRKRGVGAHLLRLAIAEGGSAGKPLDVLATDDEGFKFMHRWGGTLRSRWAVNRVLLDELDVGRLSSIVQQATAQGALRAETFFPQIPESLWHSIAGLFWSGVVASSPDRANSSPPSSLGNNRATGNRSVVSVIFSSEGVPIALSVAGWIPGLSEYASHTMTTVRDGWRGRNLAKAAKSELLLFLRSLPDPPRSVFSLNKADNHAMLAVNRSVGFRVVRWTGLFRVGATTSSTRFDRSEGGVIHVH